MTQSTESVANLVNRLKTEFDQLLHAHKAEGSQLERLLQRRSAEAGRVAVTAGADARALSSATSAASGNLLKGGAIVAGIGLAAAGIYAYAHHRRKAAHGNWTARIEAEQRGQPTINL